MTSEKPKFVSRAKLVREENLRHMLNVAAEVFAERGFGGATIKEVAERAQLPRANIHYYFQTKSELYSAVIENILEQWRSSTESFDENSSPREALSSYIQAKMEFSFTSPHSSKIWATEIIQGAPVFEQDLCRDHFSWSKSKGKVIKKWIDEGLIIPIEPQNLLNMIWATTQYYADYDHLIAAMNGKKPLSKKQKAKAIQNVTDMILRAVLTEK